MKGYWQEFSNMYFGRCAVYDFWYTGRTHFALLILEMGVSEYIFS